MLSGMSDLDKVNKWINALKSKYSPTGIEPMSKHLVLAICYAETQTLRCPVRMYFLLKIKIQTYNRNYIVQSHSSITNCFLCFSPVRLFFYQHSPVCGAQVFLRARSYSTPRTWSQVSSQRKVHNTGRCFDSVWNLPNSWLPQTGWSPEPFL